eukprot:PITA_16889
MAIPKAPDVQETRTAFVKQYYNVLVRLPESLYKFYQNCSIVGRPDPSGQMISVTTVGGINQLKSGYFLLNDVVRYLGEPPQREEQNVSEDAAKAYAVSGPVVKPEEVGQNDVSEASTRALEEPANVADEVHKNDMQQKEVTEDSGGQKGSEIEQADNGEPPRPPQETPVEVQARQMTYASVLKQNAARPVVAVKKSSIVTGRAVPNSTQRTATTSISTAPSSNHVNMTVKSTAEESGFSIFLKNLPVNVTASQLGEELKKFGAIKPSGDKGGSSTPSYKEVVANRGKKPMEYDKGPPQGRKRKSEQEQDGNKSRENNSTKENEEEDKE